MTGKSLHTFISFIWVVAMSIMLTPTCFGQGTNSFNCPTSTSIFPCSCRKFISYHFQRPYGEGATIDCARKNLSDSQISRVLDTFQAPGVGSVVELLASFNQLTRVPKQISKFPALSIVDFNCNRISEIASEDGRPFLNTRFRNVTATDIYLNNNQIKRIPSGVFDFPQNAYSFELHMTDNQISSISSGAIRTSALDVQIYLSRNKLNNFPAGVFNFPSAFGVIMDLDYNEIGAIPSSAFNLSAKYIDINFDSNKISSIHVNAFNITSTKTLGLTISLSRNYITAINCGTFISLSLVSVTFRLSYNQIETIPSCAFIFPSSTYVILNLENNLITTISRGAFNFPTALIYLNLSNNQISSIPPDTLSQGRISTLSLSNNKLKRFESSVFKTALNRIVFPSPSSVNITGNPIDCLTDPCHLAWLLQSTNTSQLLHRISADGICSSNGGSPFSTLNSYDFSKNCVCSYN